MEEGKLEVKEGLHKIEEPEQGKEKKEKTDKEPEVMEPGKKSDNAGEKPPKKIRWVHINPRYMSICRYALFVIFSAILLYIIVSHWGQTIGFLKNMIHVLTPFLIGVLIAYFINPLVDRIDWLMQKKAAKGKLPRVTKILSMIIAYVIVLGFIVVSFLSVP